MLGGGTNPPLCGKLLCWFGEDEVPSFCCISSPKLDLFYKISTAGLRIMYVLQRVGKLTV